MQKEALFVSVTGMGPFENGQSRYLWEENRQRTFVLSTADRPRVEFYRRKVRRSMFLSSNQVSSE